MPSRRTITALDQISRRSPKRPWSHARGSAPPQPRTQHGSRVREWFAPRQPPTISVYIQSPQLMTANSERQGGMGEIGDALTSVQQTLNQYGVVDHASHRRHELPHPARGQRTEVDSAPTITARDHVKRVSKPSDQTRKPTPRAPVHSLADAVALGLRSDTIPHARHRTSSERPWGRIDAQTQRRQFATIAGQTLDRRMMIALIVSVAVVGLVTTLLSVGM